MASGWVASQVGATNPTFNLSIALKLASLSDQVYEKTPEETLLCFDEDTVLGIGGVVDTQGFVAQEEELRGGLVCLNSAARFDKWNRAAVR